MNANELADDLWACFTKSDWEYVDEAVAMLRQQQAEIGALKQIIDANNLSQNIGQFRKPANEPVAWMREDGVIAFHKQKEVDSQGYKWQPLYTHTVKDLEDIDINITWNENSMRDFGKDELNFARAILRKAQE